MIFRTFRVIVAMVALFGRIGGAHAAYYPNDGDLYYNGAYYLDSYFRWSATGPFSVADPGYEHDLWVHDPNFFTSTCTTYTNLPDGYNDCPTAGIGDSNGPVFSFGSFDALAIAPDTTYVGAWAFTTHGVAGYTPFNLQGQENENRCLGLPTIWCMFSTQTKDLIIGWYMVWGGYPSYVTW